MTAVELEVAVMSGSLQFALLQVVIKRERKERFGKGKEGIKL